MHLDQVGRKEEYKILIMHNNTFNHDVNAGAHVVIPAKSSSSTLPGRDISDRAAELSTCRRVLSRPKVRRPCAPATTWKLQRRLSTQLTQGKMSSRPLVVGTHRSIVRLHTSHDSSLRRKDVDSLNRPIPRKSIKGIQYFRLMIILCILSRGSLHSRLCDSLLRS